MIRALVWLVVLGLTVAFPAPALFFWLAAWILGGQQRKAKAVRLARQQLELAQLQQGTAALEQRIRLITSAPTE